MEDHGRKILVKERYGSTPKKKYYVKPEGQSNVVPANWRAPYDYADLFRTIFLPRGYPDSVSKDYLSYQVWDTAQAFCSTITGILATQEVLRGVGVGDTEATPLAATITWVIKDGCGHLGKIIFAYSHGNYLDSYSKKWRLYADILNDAAMCIEIGLPLFRNYITFALCVSTVMKSIVGVTGGATRVAMTQHHAIRGNLGDVSAKDAAQETAVNLIASITALFIISTFGSSLFLFTLMLILHIVFNYLAVRAVCLNTLNEPRFLYIIDYFLKNTTVPETSEVNRNEPILPFYLGSDLLDIKMCGFHIKIGNPMSQIVKKNMKVSHFQKIVGVYDNSNFILFPDYRERIIYIFLKTEAVVDDVLCAYFHTVLLATLICSINGCPLTAFKCRPDQKPFADMCKSRDLAEWNEASSEENGVQYEATPDLHRIVLRISKREWGKLKDGLLSTGWDLSKHLLVTDEWRVYNLNIETETVTQDNESDIQSIAHRTLVNTLLKTTPERTTPPPPPTTTAPPPPPVPPTQIGLRPGEVYHAMSSARDRYNTENTFVETLTEKDIIKLGAPCSHSSPIEVTSKYMLNETPIEIIIRTPEDSCFVIDDSSNFNKNEPELSLNVTI